MLPTVTHDVLGIIAAFIAVTVAAVQRVTVLSNVARDLSQTCTHSHVSDKFQLHLRTGLII